MSILSSLSAVTSFVAERLPVEKMNFNSMVAKKDVPVHRYSWAYYLGGLALFFFTVQVLTGLMLLFYYEPTVSDAHASVEYLTTHVSGGATIRNLHSWSSSAMIFCVMVHMLTAFAMKAFEKPRELIWISGVFLLLVTFTFGFTGYLLPWNQIAVNATKVGLQSIEEIGNYLPGALSQLPKAIKETIQGEASVGQATLSRFYALHVVVLPLITLVILGMHLFSVQLHGMSRGIDRAPKGYEKFFPTFMLKDFSLWGVVFMVLFIVALCLPFDAFFSYPLGEPYNPMGSTPEGIKPEWYFYFLYYPLEMLPFWVVFLGMNLSILVLLAAPWIFPGTKRKTLRLVTVAVGIYLVIMTVFGDAIYQIVKGGE
jgi:cytochrome b6